MGSDLQGTRPEPDCPRDSHSLQLRVGVWEDRKRVCWAETELEASAFCAIEFQLVIWGRIVFYYHGQPL